MKRFVLTFIIAVFGLNFFASGVNAKEIDKSVEEALLAEKWELVYNLLRQDDSLSELPVARMLMAQVCLATNKNNESVRLILSAKEEADLKQWLEWTNALLARYSQNPVALYLSADANARQGKFKEASEQLTQAIALKNDFALAYNARGVVRILNNDWNNALEDFLKATQCAPKLAEAFVNLGTFWIIEEAADGALEAFNQALSNNPEFALAYNGLGCAYFGKGKFEIADQYFKMALELEPLLVVAEINQGLASAYAHKVMIMDNIEQKPGTTLESLNYQYSNILKEQQRQIRTALSSSQELLNINFSFLAPKTVFSLVERHGSDKVKIALAQDLIGMESRIAESSLKIMRELSNAELRNARAIITDKLTTVGYSTSLSQLSRDRRSWSSFTEPLDFSTTSDLNQWSRDLRESATRDIMDWAVNNLRSAILETLSAEDKRNINIARHLIDGEISSAIIELLPPWAKNIEKVYSIVRDIARDSDKTPAETLDRLKPMASLGGPMSGLLVPFLKGYYSIVFEAMGSIDIKNQMSSMDKVYQSPPSMVEVRATQTPGYYTSIDQDLTEIGKLASMVNDKIAKPSNGSSRRALVVADDPFRASLQTQELLRYSFDTKLVSSVVDVQSTARQWGADVIVGIKGNPNWWEDEKKGRFPPWFPPPPPPPPPPIVQPPRPIPPRTEPPDPPRGGGGAIGIPKISPPPLHQNWDWGKPYIPPPPKIQPGQILPGGIDSSNIAKAFMDKGGWPVMSPFTLFYKIP